MGRASGRGCIDATTVGSLPRRTKTPKPPPAAASTPLIDELPPEGSVGSAAAHRPSRRTEIIDAAIRLFARKGFVDASISEVAEEAGVVVNAIYYHFASKEELFTAAVQSVFSSISAMVATVRAADAPGDEEALDAVIDAVWFWIDAHPDEATLIHLQLPGATPQIAALRHEFEEMHTERAFGYLGSPEGRKRASAHRRAIESLSARTFVDLLISVHTMRLGDGPLSREPNEKLRVAARALAHRLVTID